MCGKNFNNKKTTSPAPLSQKAPMAPALPEHFASQPSTTKATPIPNKPGRDTGCGFIAPRAFLEDKLTTEVKKYADNSHRGRLEEAEKIVKMVLLTLFTGIQIWTTGSLPAGVDLPDSDVDMTVKLPSKGEETPMKKLFRMRSVLMQLDIFSKVYVQKARVPVLQLKMADTGVEIDVTVDNEDGKRNTQLLVWYGQVDSRFPLLCRVVKAWASAVGVQGAAKGRLNSFTLCMMVINYLQSCSVLPNLQECCEGLEGPIHVANDDYQKRNVREELEASGHRFGVNRSPIGCLFAGFLKYYADFDFRSNWISIRRGKILPKRRDSEDKPLDGMPEQSGLICVADPFIEWNCGGSVWHSETFERLHAEFGISFKRLLDSRSIFGGLGSLDRRRINDEGRERDLSIEKWKAEMEAERRKKSWHWTPLEMDELLVHWTRPFSDNKHPKVYWDESKDQKNVLEPWPEATRMFY